MSKKIRRPKMSKLLRKAAELIHENEKYRPSNNELRDYWNVMNDDGTYSEFQFSYGMCSAMIDANNKAISYHDERNDWDYESEYTKEFEDYLQPFAPRVRDPFGDYWLPNFSAKDQEVRILILLMAADMAEDNGD